jgi:hypothetical protein
VRLWSLHPSLLDRAALVSCWREGLLAQKVLAGGTRGYTKHPQLERFRACDDPTGAIGHFLSAVRAEATVRGYRFDITRVTNPDAACPVIPVTTGQLEFELDHLRRKVTERDPSWLPRLPQTDAAGLALGVLTLANPTFQVVPGGIASWERP